MINHNTPFSSKFFGLGATVAVRNERSPGALTVNLTRKPEQLLLNCIVVMRDGNFQKTASHSPAYLARVNPIKPKRPYKFLLTFAKYPITIGMPATSVLALVTNARIDMKTKVAPVQYPVHPDTTIVVGDKVRSFDFPGDATCYFVGTVTKVRQDAEQYDIAVEYQVWEDEVQETNYCASVHPPLNGMRGIFGLVRGVQRIVEGE